jgi:hypothetical protein
MTKEVTFEKAEGPLNDRFDDGHRKKYKASPYLVPIISEQARSATVRIAPRDEKS